MLCPSTTAALRLFFPAHREDAADEPILRLQSASFE